MILVLSFFFLHLPPFPLDFILRLHADGCRLAGMLTLDAWLKKIALRKQLTLDTPSEPPVRDSDFRLVLCAFICYLLNCSPATLRVCRGTSVSAPQAQASATDWGASGEPPKSWKSDVCTASYY